MMKGALILFVLTFSIQDMNAAEVLRGYMLDTRSSQCINTATVIATFTSLNVDEALLSSTCTLMSVQDGSGTGKYIIKKHGDDSKKLTLTAGQVASFTQSGTEITFTTPGSSSPMTGLSPYNMQQIATDLVPVNVASVADGTDQTDCFKLDGTYHQGSATEDCQDDLWFFEPATCHGKHECVCNPTDAICYECEDDEAATTDQRQCFPCDGVTDCLTCTNDGSDGINCLTCANSKVPSLNGDACVAPGDTVNCNCNCNCNCPAGSDVDP